MKRTLIFIILTIVLTLVGMAEKKRIPMKIQRQERPKQENGPNRVPKHSPVEVLYDTESMTVTVVGDTETEAEVYLLTESGEIEDFSTTLNTSFTLTSSGIHVVHIKTPVWIGEGVIEN